MGMQEWEQGVGRHTGLSSLGKPGAYLPGNAAQAGRADRQVVGRPETAGRSGGRGEGEPGPALQRGSSPHPAWEPRGCVGRACPASAGPPLTSLVSELNLRFWMVLLSWMLFSNFIIWF